MAFNLQLYRQTWQRLNNSQIVTQQPDIATSIPLHIFDSISSTNTKLWEFIDSGIETPVGAIALKQTAGKGQWGKSWVSSDGGLYLSVGLDLDLAINKHSHIVMATAWGIAIVLRHYQLPVTIKWSNDLILEQRKLGGIKIETRNSQHQITQAVVGVGINWCNPVPAIGINLQSYYQDKSQKNITSLEELAAITTYGILLGYRYYLSVGIEQLLIDYLAILSSLGQQVMFNNCPGKVTGVTIEGKLKVRLRSPGATTEIALAPGQISLGY
ncbi:biotin--[acetyl-CoA-carboxylase] ligase [Pleurocapsa sp. PCC 7319]|uniref:biotin--[acetyl-CoA-carboxylase] ligase n=1 Tax=Pleurocapsa sp. PCC 7319 TaxID=118161 RepID=UPI00034C68A3|nr:biotin--[acetyl-CoA-carboxylase] ligase [Pleurocapsa sp. PCC 7319]